MDSRIAWNSCMHRLLYCIIELMLCSAGDRRCHEEKTTVNTVYCEGGAGNVCCFKLHAETPFAGDWH
jgi:hypothetical protein